MHTHTHGPAKPSVCLLFFRAEINFYIAVGPFRLYAIIIILSAIFFLCLPAQNMQNSRRMYNLCVNERLLNWHSCFLFFFRFHNLLTRNVCVIATVLQINRYQQQRLNYRDYLLMKSRHCHKIS